MVFLGPWKHLGPKRYLTGVTPVELAGAPGWDRVTRQRNNDETKGPGLLTAGVQPSRYTFNAESHRNLDAAL